MSDTRDPRVIVVGAGMAGIAVGHKLKEAGFNDFTILEKGDDVGGVWYWNRYPGLTCDVPSQAYQYPFAPRTDWPRLFATGSEIQAYHRKVAEDLDVMPHIRCGQEVTAAEFTGSGWRVTTAAGEALECDFLIAATGVLHHPNIPDIPGLDSFQGAVVHTARWDDSVRLEGKRVAAIGTGSTGVQVVSAMQPVVAQVTSFIRTPQWVLWAPMSLRQPKFVAKLLDALPATHRALHGPDGHGCFGQHCDAARLGTAFGAAVRACLPTSDPRQGAEAEAHPGLRAAVQASSAVRFVPSCCTEAERRDCHRPHQQDHSDGDRDGGWHRARIRRDRPGHRVPGAQLHAPHESGWQGWVFD